MKEKGGIESPAGAPHADFACGLLGSLLRGRLYAAFFFPELSYRAVGFIKTFRNSKKKGLFTGHQSPVTLPTLPPDASPISPTAGTMPTLSPNPPP